MIKLLKKYKEVCGSHGFGSFLLIMSFCVSFGVAIVYVPKDLWVVFMVVFLIGQVGVILCSIQFSRITDSKTDLIKEYEEGLLRLGQDILQIAPIKVQDDERWESSKKVWQRASVVFDFINKDNKKLAEENNRLMEERVELTSKNEKLRLREKEKMFGEKLTAIADLKMEE